VQANGVESISGVVLCCIRDQIKLKEERDESQGPESEREMKRRIISMQETERLQDEFMSKIKVTRLDKGQKLFDLNQSYNIVLNGQIRNNHNGELHG
jgi:hypothetical protein